MTRFVNDPQLLSQPLSWVASAQDLMRLSCSQTIVAYTKISWQGARDIDHLPVTICGAHELVPHPFHRRRTHAAPLRRAEFSDQVTHNHATLRRRSDPKLLSVFRGLSWAAEPPAAAVVTLDGAAENGEPAGIGSTAYSDLGC